MSQSSVLMPLQTDACELSVSMLSRLRELVKEYCLSPMNRDIVSWVGGAGSRCFEVKSINFHSSTLSHSRL
jgi:hypothetical protein